MNTAGTAPEPVHETPPPVPAAPPAKETPPAQAEPVIEIIDEDPKAALRKSFFAKKARPAPVEAPRPQRRRKSMKRSSRSTRSPTCPA